MKPNVFEVSKTVYCRSKNGFRKVRVSNLGKYANIFLLLIQIGVDNYVCVCVCLCLPLVSPILSCVSLPFALVSVPCLPPVLTLVLGHFPHYCG